MSWGGNARGGNVLGGKCPGGKRPGGKRPGGKRPRIIHTCTLYIHTYIIIQSDTHYHISMKYSIALHLGGGACVLVFVCGVRKENARIRHWAAMESISL